MAKHNPYVQPFADVTAGYVVRCDCGCGLFEQYANPDDAEEVRQDCELDG